MFPNQLTDEDFKRDHSYQPNLVGMMHVLKNLSYVQSFRNVVGGSSDSTVSDFVMSAQTTFKINDVKAIINVPNTGADNIPTISLYNQTKSVEITTPKEIPLGKASGNVEVLSIDTDNHIIDPDDVLAVKIVTPTGTITTALKVDIQVEYQAYTKDEEEA